MAAESVLSVVTVLLVAARAVNILMTVEEASGSIERLGVLPLRCVRWSPRAESSRELVVRAGPLASAWPPTWSERRSLLSVWC
jgi:hypothetical protein